MELDKVVASMIMYGRKCSMAVCCDGLRQPIGITESGSVV